MEFYIPVSPGRFAIVDIDDYEHLSKFKWHSDPRGNNIYAKRLLPILGPKRPRLTNGEKRARIPQYWSYMHREILGIGEDLVVDHINHNGLDNRRSNIRICTHTDNMKNRMPNPNHSSKFKGVSRPSKGRWIAYIGHRSLGRFDSEVEAALAYDQAAKIEHGQFARLNFQ